MPSSKSSATTTSTGKTSGNNNHLALKHLRQRNNSSSAKKGGGKRSSISLTNNRYWLYWISIVTAAAVSVFLSQQYAANTNQVRLSQAEQLGEPSEDDVINLWTQNCAHGAVTQVPVVPFTEMTPQRFHREFLLPRKAVVIAGAYAASPLTATATATTEATGRNDGSMNDEKKTNNKEEEEDRWSFAGLRQAYGHVLLKTLIPLKRGQNVKCTPSGLCQGPVMTLAKLFEETFLMKMSQRIQRKFDASSSSSNADSSNHIHNNAYPHDIDLATTLPDVFDIYQKLNILTENLHLATRSGNLDRWPSLFLGPATTKTGLHVDNFGTSFTMAVFRGRKQFILFDVADGNENLCLDAPLPGSNYGVDVFAPNFRSCPKAQRAHAQFASLGPGDLLYVPGSMHHAARNMDDSLGIAQNFLTIADYHSVVESHKGPSVQSLRRLRNQPIVLPTAAIPDSLLAQLDLFQILQETGYYHEYYDMDSQNNDDDDSSNDNDKNDNTISFLSVPDSVRLATERVVHHLEKALEQDPLLATRVAFLASNPYVVLSLKAAGVWHCLENNNDSTSTRRLLHEKFLSTSSPPVPLKEVDNEVFHRIRQALAAATTTATSLECQTRMRQYVNTLAMNHQRALAALEEETGL